MRGKGVVQLQTLLQRMGYEIADQKGLFGTTTRDAVKAYQKQHGLKPTGLVDEALLQRMQQGVAPAAEAGDEDSHHTMPNHQAQDDMAVLVRLLIKKGIFSQDEWDAERTTPTPNKLF